MYKLFIAHATSPRAANKVFCNFPFNLIMLFISVKRERSYTSVFKIVSFVPIFLLIFCVGLSGLEDRDRAVNKPLRSFTMPEDGPYKY